MMISNMTALDDADLVARSRSGDLDAFGELVSRYQSLVCSLAYSATGSLPQSEDLAQETFLTAWRQLAHLREPGKLRSWICGIARNIINNFLRKQGREPSHRAEPIEHLAEQPSVAPQPGETAISNEEAALLWRTLAKIPDSYREPLVLFYRERQSIQNVAEALDLTEDAVKQRLSRGRKMLEAEMASFVETTLTRSAPGRAFTLAVLAAVPTFALSASAATVGATAAKGSTAASSAAAVSILNIAIGPIIGLLGAWMGAKASLNATRTPREREFVVSQIKRFSLVAVGFNVLLFAFIFLAIPHFREHPILLGTIGILLPVSFTAFIIAASVHQNRRMIQIRAEELKANPNLFKPEEFRTLKEHKSKATFLGLPLFHMRFGQTFGEKPQPARGWIALGDKAIGILFAGGGLAVGGIAMGGVAIGGIALGGMTLGALSFGGLAIGALAVGGGTIGLFSAGGLAIGYFGAMGGMAIAKEFAIGGLAYAAHANDPVAKEFFNLYPLFDITRPEVRNRIQSLIWLPVIFVVIQSWFIQKRKRQPKAPSPTP